MHFVYRQKMLWQFIYSQSLDYKILYGKRTTDSVHINILPQLRLNGSNTKDIYTQGTYKGSLYKYRKIFTIYTQTRTVCAYHKSKAVIKTSMR